MSDTASSVKEVADAAPSARQVGTALTTPHAAAIAGILFAVLLGASLMLIQLSVSSDELDDGSWLLNDRGRVTTGIPLIPIAGVCFLWFVGVVRHQLGKREDQFYGTVFQGAAFLFLAMLFAGTAVTAGMVGAQDQDPEFVSSGRYLPLGKIAVVVLETYALKMAGVFLFSLGAIWLKTGVMPKWVAVSQFVVGAVLLFGVAQDQRAVLIFPLWILLVSVYLLIYALRDPQRWDQL